MDLNIIVMAGIPQQLLLKRKGRPKKLPAKAATKAKKKKQGVGTNAGTNWAPNETIVGALMSYYEENLPNAMVGKDTTVFNTHMKKLGYLGPVKD